MADEHADTPDNPADEVEAQDPAEQPAGEGAPMDEPAQEPIAEEAPADEPAGQEPVAEPVAEESAAEPAVEEVPTQETPAMEQPAEQVPVAEEPVDEDDEDEEEPPQRVKPAVPGAHLEVDIVPEGVDPLGRSEHEYEDPYALEDALEESEQAVEEEQDEELTQPIATAAIDLASGARYRATGKRKTAIARVTLRPGTGEYLVNGRPLDTHFPRTTLQRNIRQPLETVGSQDRMDVVARLHGGGISAQAGALRHGVSRALLEADPNLRGELKRRGFLTRDSRAKERKKAGLKKARKRPQFSKR
jgi:small subunit ribosomal protein S9